MTRKQETQTAQEKLFSWVHSQPWYKASQDDKHYTEDHKKRYCTCHTGWRNLKNGDCPNDGITLKHETDKVICPKCKWSISIEKYEGYKSKITTL